MRGRVWRALAIAGLLAAPLPAAASGVVAVSVPGHRVETSRLMLGFDAEFPEMLLQVVYKDWNPGVDLAGDITTDERFFGQALRNVAHAGYFVPSSVASTGFSATQPMPDLAHVMIASQSGDQAPVTTRYTFYGDVPWFKVDRTVYFSSVPDSFAYQPYTPMLASVGSYKAVRYRTKAGQYVQRIYCPGDCVTEDWDGRWIQQYTQIGDSHPLTVATVWKNLGESPRFVRRFDLDTNLRWASAIRPAQYRETDEQTSLYVVFSTTSDDTTTLDSLWTDLNGPAELVTDVPTPARHPSLIAMAAAPNPSVGATTLSWTLPIAGRATLQVHDPAGRLVATLWDGVAAAGAHRAVWDGRSRDGTNAPPGVYLARLVTPAGSRTLRLARVH